MTAFRSLIHPCVICIMFLLNTDGKVGIRSATSQRLRLDLKCGVPPETEMLGTISPARPAETDPGFEADERHGWRLSQHQSRSAPALRLGSDRRDLEIQESDAECDLTSYPASLPELARAQP